MGIQLAVDNSNKEYDEITGLWLPVNVHELRWAVVDKEGITAYCLFKTRKEALEYVVKSGRNDITVMDF